jgi:putative hydrolase of the HAD superfamily
LLVTVSIAPEVRAIVFDAVGTLIHPEPAAALVYAEAGQRFGSSHSTTAITSRFATAFRRQDAIDYAAGLRTSEVREVDRWQAIVTEVLDDVMDAAACFRYLYEHFARPSAWRIDADTPETLAALQARGYRLAIASNFDHRLRDVLAPSALRDLPLVISATVGWRKPAAEFFAATCRAVAAEPREILYVGDDPDNDYEGARQAGQSAVLYDPRHRAGADVARLARLSDLLKSERMDPAQP